ncbi:MAG: hypothetical protein ACYTKD_11745 [Planctomycetota bacterium]|jgi:hypothetical protein
MCLIVDTNVAHRALLDPADPEFEPVYESLFGDGRPDQTLVYGGALADEYNGSRRISRAVEELLRAGRARREDDDAVNGETTLVTQKCTSNDPHVIALARVSGVRLLCTHDKNSGLMADFKNKTLIDKPGGKIYTRKKKNSKLLSAKCPCKRCK